MKDLPKYLRFVFSSWEPSLSATVEKFCTPMMENMKRKSMSNAPMFASPGSVSKRVLTICFNSG